MLRMFTILSLSHRTAAKTGNLGMKDCTDPESLYGSRGTGCACIASIMNLSPPSACVLVLNNKCLLLGI